METNEMMEAVNTAEARLCEWMHTQGLTLLGNVVAAIVILIFGMLAIKLVGAALRKAVERVGRGNDMMLNFICSVVNKTLWALLTVVVLGKLGVDVAPIIAGLGVTGFILGFAFQESLGNLASGMMIAINRPFKVGDYISAAGNEGTVQKLDMMATTLTTGDNKKVVLPNKTVWGSPITNFSALALRRVDIKVGVAYGSNLSLAKQVIRDALAKVEGVLADPRPTVETVSLDDSAVAIVVRPWCANADYWKVYFAVTQQVKEALDQSGVEIPFPQIVVNQPSVK